MRRQHESDGITFSSSSSTSRASYCRARAGAIADAKHMGIDRHGVLPHAMLSTTLAVLRPARGSPSRLGAGCAAPAAELGDSIYQIAQLKRSGWLR